MPLTIILSFFQPYKPYKNSRHDLVHGYNLPTLISKVYAEMAFQKYLLNLLKKEKSYCFFLLYPPKEVLSFITFLMNLKFLKGLVRSYLFSDLLVQKTKKMLFLYLSLFGF